MKKDLFCANGEKWRVVAKISDRNYLMAKVGESGVSYAPLIILSFRLYAPRMDIKDVQFVHQYKSHKEITTVYDRIRWCRMKKGLMQKEVAKKLGVTRAIYGAYEKGSADYYPKELMDKLAQIFEVNVYDLLDDYNRFMYEGQGRLIHEYRIRNGLNKKAMARLLNIEPHTLDNWETDKKRMNIHSWNKYFKNIMSI